MTTFRKTAVKDEIAGDEPLSDYALAYLTGRVRNSFYNFVLERFQEAVEREGLSKAKLSKRLGIAPARVTRLLRSPGNWTLDTASTLLVGICREELQPTSHPYLGRTARNFQPADLFYSPSPNQQFCGTALNQKTAGFQTKRISARTALDSRESQSRAPRLPNIEGQTS